MTLERAGLPTAIVLIKGVRPRMGGRFRASLQDITELRRTEGGARVQAETQRLRSSRNGSRRVLLSTVEDVKASEAALRDGEAIFSHFKEIEPDLRLLQGPGDPRAATKPQPNNCSGSRWRS